MMEDAILLGGAFIVVGIPTMIAGFKALKKKRYVENIPTSTIRGAAMGLVELTGVVDESGQEKSPFFQEPCMYCQWTVEKRRKTKNGYRYIKIQDGELGRYFYIKDETGTCLVDARGAELDTKGHIRRTIRTDELSEQADEFAKERGLDLKNFLGFNRTVRITEKIIRPHQTVYVMGTAQDNPHVAEGSQSEGFKDMMIGKGSQDPILMISTEQEKQFLKKLRIRSRGFLISGPLLIIIGAALVLFPLFS